MTVRPRRIDWEEGMQIRCLAWLRIQYPNVWAVTHHSPNGGRRSLTEGARFKAMGVKAGFPDLFIYEARGGHHGLALELKTTAGRQSPQQRQWQRELEGRGYRYAVVRSLEEFMTEVRHYLTGKIQ